MVKSGKIHIHFKYANTHVDIDSEEQVCIAVLLHYAVLTWFNCTGIQLRQKHPA
jgi:hypothetical protein